MTGRQIAVYFPAPNDDQERGQTVHTSHQECYSVIKHSWTLSIYRQHILHIVGRFSYQFIAVSSVILIFWIYKCIMLQLPGDNNEFGYTLEFDSGPGGWLLCSG